MSEQLARKYRPGRFGDVAGQREVTALLYLMCKGGTVPGSMLLSGERGCGKTSMARIVGRALNCEAAPGPAKRWPCLACPSCLAVANGTSPYVEEVDAASVGNIEEVRRLRTRALFGVPDGHWMVFIIDEAHALTGAGAEGLLKITEEPPPGVVFIFVTTKPGSLPKTIRDRAAKFEFAPHPVPVITERLAWVCAQEGIDAEPELISAIAEAAEGGMRDALVRLDQVTSVGITSVAMWRELTGETDFAPVMLAAAADGDYAALFAVLETAMAACGDPGHVTRELVRCLSGLLVLSCGGTIRAAGAALEARQALAARLGRVRAAGAMSVLWDLQTQIRVDDRETALPLALAELARKLGPPPAAEPIAPEGGTASLADIRGILENA